MDYSALEEQNERIRNHRDHVSKTLWMHYANFFLGVWLIAGAFTIQSGDHKQFINDIICGLLVSILSLISIHPFRFWASWIIAFIGLWLNVAPLLFWTESPAIYYNHMLIGILIMAFAFVIPGIPGSKLYETKGPDIPPGWSVNPSSWIQRAPIIFLGWLVFFTSRYLAAYQLGYIHTAWDPFFAKGTENVLNSEVSKAWPVSDAGLGAFSYMLDAMMAYIGGENRWRTMPWIVILFGILIIPLGAVSIILIILQPLAVGAWCSICLFTAIVMLIMIPCTFDEVFASLEFLKKSKKEGKSVWRTFWKGGTTHEKSNVFIKHDFSLPFHKTLKAMFSGFVIPWNLMLTCIAGTWLMLSSVILEYSGNLAKSDQLVGALIITFSVIAMGEVVRSIRIMNILLGIWIVIAPFVMKDFSNLMLVNAIITGIIIILLSIPRGKILNTYGSFNRYIF